MIIVYVTGNKLCEYMYTCNTNACNLKQISGPFSQSCRYDYLPSLTLRGFPVFQFCLHHQNCPHQRLSVNVYAIGYQESFLDQLGVSHNMLRVYQLKPSDEFLHIRQALYARHLWYKIQIVDSPDNTPYK